MQVFKIILGFISVLVVIAFIGLLVKKDSPLFPDKEDNKTVSQQNTSEEPKDQYRIGVTFTGDKSEIVDLVQGKATFDLTYLGNSKFTARILKPDGDVIGVLADVTGHYKGTRMMEIPETGSYLMDVKTTGEWSIARK
jgi:hypothetical protein